MKRIFAVLLPAFAVGVQAQVVGTFDNTRLMTEDMNLASGDWLSGMRECFQSRGAPITTTGTLTPAYLSGVTVFFTSEFLNDVPSNDEVAAVVAWVQNGGTLIVTGECG
ncbi:MAG: hypothetical protein AMXMBFR61_23160 [Fimbriimonadales bacterium]